MTYYQAEAKALTLLTAKINAGDSKLVTDRLYRNQVKSQLIVRILKAYNTK
jgi:hypothetical protein